MKDPTHSITAHPTCSTCGAEGELTRLKTPGGKLIPSEVGFICSKDSKHWEIYELHGFSERKK